MDQATADHRSQKMPRGCGLPGKKQSYRRASADDLNIDNKSAACSASGRGIVAKEREVARRGWWVTALACHPYHVPGCVRSSLWYFWRGKTGHTLHGRAPSDPDMLFRSWSWLCCVSVSLMLHRPLSLSLSLLFPLPILLASCCPSDVRHVVVVAVVAGLAGVQPRW